MLLSMKKKGTAAILLSFAMLLSASACSKTTDDGKQQSSGKESTVNSAVQPENEIKKAEKNGEVYILYTSDVHCGIDQGFGYVGLKQVRDSLEQQGYETILVDDGDSVQGEFIGTLDEGESVISLMNDLKYDVAIPGNHEFDYGMDTFLGLTKKADFPYISCNFTHEGKLVLEPYVIKEAAGMKIAFVGVSTPDTITTSTPSYFKNEKVEYVYDFMKDETGQKLYDAVQKSVDDARKEGADLVYLMGHMGNSAGSSPWNYADVLSHTSGIDVMLDGHSHDTDQVVMKNRDGKDVVRTACGTKLEAIGYSRIAADKTVAETNIWSWLNLKSAVNLLNIQNDMTEKVDHALSMGKEKLSKVIGTSEVNLTINDPVEKDRAGNPIRVIRTAETNLGDFCMDAIREETKAQIALLSGGCIRKDISKGDITVEDIYNNQPFGNHICVIKATGQQVLDSLEWGVHTIPDEFGGFPQVSGISFEVDTSVKSGCQEDDSGMLTGIEGERRIKNVLVDGKPIDPKATYTVAGVDYCLLDNGDGYTAFNGAEMVEYSEKTDAQVTFEYIQNKLGGVVGSTYADPYGQGRIVIK